MKLSFVEIEATATELKAAPGVVDIITDAFARISNAITGVPADYEQKEEREVQTE